MIRKVAHVGDLFDFYSPLLTDRQREWTELHYLEDWSLSEIAEQYGVSRQAVHDNLRRALEQMEAYEAALRLVRLHQARHQIVAALRMEWEDAARVMSAAQSERIRMLLDELAASG